MKYALSTLAISVSALLLTGCLKDRELSFQPTLAIPIVEGEMSIGDLIGATPSEIDRVVFKISGTDTVFTYRMIYTDTLDPLTLSNFGGTGSATQDVPAGSYPFPERNVFLRMTGKAESGEFQFTDPTVEFHFDNKIGLDFNLYIENTYTKDKFSYSAPYDFTITNQPTTIPANGSAVFIVENANTVNGKHPSGGALSDVFSPVPKYLYYTPRLTTSGGNDVVNGNLNIYSKVILPFTGYGEVTYRDTMPYSFDADQLNDVLDFAYLRFKFVNSMPLEAKVTGYIVDTSTYAIIANLPLYDSSTGDSAGSNYAIIPGKINGIDSATTDVRIYKSNPITGKNDIETLAEGNAIFIDMTFGTVDFINSQSVSILSDQKMKFSMGIKTKAGYEISSEELRDTLGF